MKDNEPRRTVSVNSVEHSPRAPTAAEFTHQPRRRGVLRGPDNYVETTLVGRHAQITPLLR